MTKATVLRALAKSRFFSDKLKKLPNGIDTHLTREFDEKGTNLSGGEQQKVAISRVFAADYPIIIMDEPSSALDPTAEYHLNRSVLKYTENKTVVFISHRLSTTRIADTIYMFDSGRLIECGSHNELLEKTAANTLRCLICKLKNTATTAMKLQHNNKRSQKYNV